MLNQIATCIFNPKSSPRIKSQKPAFQKYFGERIILQLPPNVYRDSFPIVQSPSKKIKSQPKYRLSQLNKTVIKNPQQASQRFDSQMNEQSNHKLKKSNMAYRVSEYQAKNSTNQMNRTFINKNKIHSIRKHNRHISMSCKNQNVTQSPHSNAQNSIISYKDQHYGKVESEKEQKSYDLSNNYNMGKYNHSKRVKSRSWGKSPNKIQSSSPWAQRFNQKQLNYPQINLRSPLKASKYQFANIDQQLGDMTNKVCIIDSQQLNKIRFLNRKKFQSDFLHTSNQNNQITSIMEYLMMKNQIIGEKIQKNQINLSNDDKRIGEVIKNRFSAAIKPKVGQQKITPLSNRKKFGSKMKQSDRMKTGLCPSPWQHQKQIQF